MSAPWTKGAETGQRKRGIFILQLSTSLEHRAGATLTPASQPRQLFTALAGHRQLSLAERGSLPAKEAATRSSPCHVSTSLSHWPHCPVLLETSQSLQSASLRGPKAQQP